MSLVRVIAAAVLLMLVYAFVMASFAFFAMFGFGIVMGALPFWFGLPPLMKWAHETAASLVRARVVQAEPSWTPERRSTALRTAPPAPA